MHGIPEGPEGRRVPMPIYKKPEEKAVETVTIRLTVDERRMLDHLSTLEV